MKTITIDGIEYNLTPKMLFKKGDWVVYDGVTYLITGVYPDGYTNDHQGFIPLKHQDEMRLWDISKDAKDGDVLCGYPGSEYSWIGIFHKLNAEDSFTSHCYLQAGLHGKFCPPRGENIFGKRNVDNHALKVIPATKEQRDLLFSKMKEAGYEWDSEKKELKKIEQEQTELPKGEDYGIDSLYHAARILEKTLGEVDGYQTDDGILEHKCAIEAVKRLYEQKSAWSEEIGSLCLDALGLLRAYGEGVDPQSQLGIKIGRASAFLADLYHEGFYPNTYNPRPDLKLTTWSEEDEEEFQIAIDTLVKAGQHDSANWLKSLRPNNTWKPSKRMLEALKWAKCEFHPDCPETMEQLKYLYQELKQLYYDRT